MEGKITRCKVFCNTVVPVDGGFKANFQACYSGSKENEAFFNLTPCINFDLQTIKEQSFTPGKEYYLDISEAK